MTKQKMPVRCPSCGLEGSLFVQGVEYVCRDPECGRAFPVDPKLGLSGKAAQPDKKPKTK